MKCPKCGNEMIEVRSEHDTAYYQVLVDSGGDYFDAEEMSRGLDDSRRFVCNCGHEEKLNGRR